MLLQGNANFNTNAILISDQEQTKLVKVENDKLVELKKEDEDEEKKKKKHKAGKRPEWRWKPFQEADNNKMKRRQYPVFQASISYL